MGGIGTMRLPSKSAKSLVLFAALVVGGCSRSQCDESKAIAVARSTLIKEVEDSSIYSSRILEDSGQIWIVELYDKDAATGGQAFFKIDKKTCNVIDWIGYQ